MAVKLGIYTAFERAEFETKTEEVVNYFFVEKLIFFFLESLAFVVQ